MTDLLNQIASLIPDTGQLFDGQYNLDADAASIRKAFLETLENKSGNPEFLAIHNEEGVLLGQKLAWDSNYFGFPVHRLDQVWAKNPVAGTELVRDYLQKLQAENYRYTSCRVKSTDTVTQNLLSSCGFELVLHKAMLRYNLSKIGMVSAPKCEPEINIRPYHNSDKTFVTELAATSSMTSRFTLDPKFDQQLAKGIYRNWANNLVERSPDSVFLAEFDQKPAGMVALADANKLYGPEINPEKRMGFISLVAVDDAFRGRSVGQALIRFAADFYKSKDYQVIFANTALQNTGSLTMFQKAGFQVFSMVSEYRLWLK